MLPSLANLCRLPNTISTVGFMHTHGSYAGPYSTTVINEHCICFVWFYTVTVEGTVCAVTVTVMVIGTHSIPVLTPSRSRAEPSHGNTTQASSRIHNSYPSQ